MSEQFFQEFALPQPEIELGVGSATHGAQTAKMLVGIEDAKGGVLGPKHQATVCLTST